MKGLISDELEDEQVLPSRSFSIPIHLSLATEPNAPTEHECGLRGAVTESQFKYGSNGTSEEAL